MKTPLHIASSLGFVEIVEKLLSAEADPTIENEVKCITSCIMHVSACNNTNIIQLTQFILFTIMFARQNGDSSLHLACSKGHTDTVKALLEHKNGKPMLEQKEKRYVNSPNKVCTINSNLSY